MIYSMVNLIDAGNGTWVRYIIFEKEKNRKYFGRYDKLMEM